MGFEHGWESRFDTWYKLMCEFGFCYYAKYEKILISDSAKMLILTRMLVFFSKSHRKGLGKHGKNFKTKFR